MKYLIKDNNKPAWFSIEYWTKEQAERDILVASCYAVANNLPVPSLYVVEA